MTKRNRPWGYQAPVDANPADWELHPDTVAVRGGLARSGFGETGEAMCSEVNPTTDPADPAYLHGIGSAEIGIARDGADHHSGQKLTQEAGAAATTTPAATPATAAAMRPSLSGSEAQNAAAVPAALALAPYMPA